MESQGRKELRTWEPVSGMLGVHTHALALLLDVAEGGVQIPEVETQGMSQGGGCGRVRASVG